MRIFLITLLLTIASGAGHLQAQESGLPDIGSSAGRLISPIQEAQYGQMLLAQLRHYNMVLEDPLVDGWLRATGNRLAAASDRPDQSFTFFMMDDRSINAFATLGGYIGVNAGLVLTAETEDEVAAVIAHEIAHVTQNHVVRGVERAQRDNVPMLLAMLAAVAVAANTDSSSSSNAAMAAIASVQGLALQRQIDYTRSNESEADRLGMRNLDRSGYDLNAMADMFERMQAVSRINQGSDRERLPDYLRTHPVTTTRISEARQRAEQLGGRRRSVTATTSTPEATFVQQVEVASGPFVSSTGTIASANPLFPGSLRLPSLADRHDNTQFDWARERLRVLSANTAAEAIREYESLNRSGPTNDARRYGLAVARLRNGEAAAAAHLFSGLLPSYPGDVWLTLGLAEAQARAGHTAAADETFEELVARMPENRAVVLTYATLLAERNTPEAGRRAQSLLRPLVVRAGNDPIFQRTFARISEIAGDPVRAGEAHAEVTLLNGRAEQALVQLNTLRQRDDLDYYARARIDARIAAITPIVLELRRQGIHDADLRRR